MLGNLEGAIVVDAFAGSGALGLEAMSRGAEKAYFFDTWYRAIEIIEQNAEIVGVGDRVVVTQCSFRQGLEEVVEGQPDLWFFDPPYGSSKARKGLEAMADESSKVTSGALVVWESDRDEEIFEIEGFEVQREKIYGRTRLLFLRRIT